MREKKYYTTKEVLARTGISRNTLFLWLKKGKVPEVAKNRNGHRLFTKADIQRIIKYKNKTILPTSHKEK